MHRMRSSCALAHAPRFRVRTGAGTSIDQMVAKQIGERLGGTAQRNGLDMLHGASASRSSISIVKARGMAGSCELQPNRATSEEWRMLGLGGPPIELRSDGFWARID